MEKTSQGTRRILKFYNSVFQREPYQGNPVTDTRFLFDVLFIELDRLRAQRHLTGDLCVTKFRTTQFDELQFFRGKDLYVKNRFRLFLGAGK